MQTEVLQLFHPLYQPAKIQQADAVAWVAPDKKSPLVMYPFKFMDLQQHEVRLKVLYTSICHSDIATIREDWGACNYPCCPGHQIIGQITKLGQQVTKVKVGDKVGVSPVRYCDLTCQYCQLGSTNMCDNREFLYEFQFGGYCTHMQVDQNWVFIIPKGMDLTIIPPLLCAGITEYAPLKRYQKVGGKCAIIGIGGLGHLGVQYANKLGMQVTAFTTKVNQVQQLRKLGVQNIQHSTNAIQLKKNEGKYDIVLNNLFLDDQQIYKSFQRLTAPHGTYIAVGLPSITTQLKIDMEYMIKNQIKVTGSCVGSINDVKQMLEFSHKNNIQIITEHYTFDKFNEALHRAEKQRPKYRVVVNVTDWAKKNGFDK